MKIFFDTEFTGLNKNTTLISIGLVSEDNKTFYAEFTDYDKSQISEWINKNIISNLILKPHHKKEQNFYNDKDGIKIRGDTKLIKENLLSWLLQFNRVEFWSDVLAYDWVLLQDLIVEYKEGYPILPGNIYYIPFDITTLMKIKGVDTDITREKLAFDGEFYEGKIKKHNALWDAKVIKKCYEKLIK